MEVQTLLPIHTLGHNSVAFVKAKVFGQEVNNNIYVLASAFDAVITVDTNGVPTLQANFENVIHEIYWRRDLDCNSCSVPDRK